MERNSLIKPSLLLLDLIIPLHTLKDLQILRKIEEKTMCLCMLLITRKDLTETTIMGGAILMEICYAILQGCLTREKELTSMLFIMNIS